MISVAVRWYLRYGLSYRDVEELLAERGITVDHVTVYRRVQRFTPEFIEAARPARRAPGDRWFADETYVRVAGRWTYLYRAIDQHGQIIDVLLSDRRDLAAAQRFFTRALRAGTFPAEVTTDRAPAYPRVPGELIPSALHTVERYANKPIDTDHGQLKAPAPADARPQAPPVRADPGRRARLHPEHSPRPLRTRHRRPRPPPAPTCLRPAHNHHLISGPIHGHCTQATAISHIAQRSPGLKPLRVFSVTQASHPGTARARLADLQKPRNAVIADGLWDRSLYAGV